MSDEKRKVTRKYLAEKACDHVRKILDDVSEEWKLSNDTYIGDDLYYTILGTLMTSHLNAHIQSAESPEEGADLYLNNKKRIEATVANAFQKVFSMVNPGTYPDFQCQVTLLDTGEPLKKDS